jgi:hypothetical protein
LSIDHLLFSEKPQDDGQEQAGQQTGRDWKVKTKIAFGVVDIPGQVAQPAFANSGPKQASNQRYEETNDDQKFSDLIHAHNIHNKAGWKKPWHWSKVTA